MGHLQRRPGLRFDSCRQSSSLLHSVLAGDGTELRENYHLLYATRNCGNKQDTLICPPTPLSPNACLYISGCGNFHFTNAADFVPFVRSSRPIPLRTPFPAPSRRRDMGVIITGDKNFSSYFQRRIESPLQLLSPPNCISQLGAIWSPLPSSPSALPLSRPFPRGQLPVPYALGSMLGKTCFRKLPENRVHCS